MAKSSPISERDLQQAVRRNEFLKLPVMHEDDNNEFRYSIHALQNIILAREGVRYLEEKH